MDSAQFLVVKPFTTTTVSLSQLGWTVAPTLSLTLIGYSQSVSNACAEEWNCTQSFTGQSVPLPLESDAAGC